MYRDLILSVFIIYCIRFPHANVFHIVAVSHTWISPSVRGEGPEAREGHSAALVGKELFIFGGCGKSSETSNEVYYNDVYILDTGKSL